jgi:TolB-like protein
VAGEIFISYRRSDEAWARLLHAQLRAEGVEAWYDVHVGAGQDWRSATAKALQASSIFVLLFSRAASESEDIAKELAAATFSRKLVVPVRIENIQPSGAFLYELASRNWVNAFENTEAKLAELARSLAQLVKAGVVDETIIPFDRNAGATAQVQKRDWLKRKPLVIAAAAAIVMVVTVAGLFWLYPRPGAVVAGSQPLPKPVGASIAVLPFLNLSSDKDQEFFSDGITEEITSALAKVPGLTVIGRTSAFQFKGENQDMRAIGRALGADSLIEGSVRKDGNQVRITAQLIKAKDGTHLWSESYDRELKGIFAVQEEIAGAIAGAMRVPLGLTQGARLVTNRTGDFDAYQQYLQAIALGRARKVDDAKALLEQVVARDPGYAPAWGRLAGTWTLPASYRSVVAAAAAGSTQEARLLAQSISNRAEQMAHEAIRLDPRLAGGYNVLGAVQGSRGNWAGRDDYTRQALTLDPDDPDILYAQAFRLAQTGRLKEAQRVQVRIQALEPFVPIYRRQAADVFWALGRNDTAIKMLESLDFDGRTQAARIQLAKVYATAGRFGQAADMLLADPAPGDVSRKSMEDAAGILRSAPAHAAPESLPELERQLSWVYLFVGAQDRSLLLLEREFAAGYYGGVFRDVWAPTSASLRKTEHFKAFVRQAHLVEYWRARGWPEFCRPVGTDDFACN